MIVLKNILVPTDLSEPSVVALDYGRDLARTFGGRLHVLHVTESLLTTAGSEFYAASLPEVQARIEKSAGRQLDAIITDDDRLQLGAVPVVRTWESAAKGIVEYASEARIDLIVMGTHGRGGFSRFLMGSVAERVVRTAPCPVLTVRHPEREFLAPDALVAIAKA